MASRSDIKAGRAYVELYLKNSALMKGLKQIREDFQKVGSLTMALGRNMMAVGVGIAGAFGAVALALKGPIEAAGDLMETTSKFQSVFGDATEEMLAFAATYSKTVGRAKSDTMSSLATMQSFFLGMGLDPAKAAEFAKQMATASVDFASFHNLSDAEGMERFISALSGSGEVLSMFGVNIMQAALDQQLLSMGFKKSTQGATEMEKVLARIAIIQQTMSKQGATNDATRTAGSFSNQMKKLRGEIKNASEAIGNALLPVVTPLVTWLAKAGAMVAEWAAKNQGLIVTIVKVAAIGALIGGAIASVGALIFGAGAGIAAIGTILTGVISAVTVIGPIIAAMLSPIGLLIGAIVACGAALIGIAGYWLFFTEEGKRAVTIIMAYFKPLLTFIQMIGQGMIDALAAGNFMLAIQIAGQALVIAFREAVKTVVGLIFQIPHAVKAMYDSLPEWMKLQLVTSLVEGGDAALRNIETSLDAASNASTGALMDMLEQAKLERELIDFKSDEIKAPDLPGPDKPAKPAIAEALKSIGSFDATALVMQNWGSIPAPKVNKEEMLKKELERLYKLSEESGHTLRGIKEAVEKAHAMYGP